MVSVANRPLMAYLLEWLRNHDVSQVLVTLHYRAGDIREAFGDGHAFGLEITYLVEETPLGTAGAVKAAEDWIDGEPFLVVSGDVLTDLDLSALCRQHGETGAWLTLGLKHVPDPTGYGVVELDTSGRVVRFQEKPGAGQAWSDLANTGIYDVEPRVLERIPGQRPYDWSRQVFPDLLKRGLPVYGYVLDGYWSDLGTISSYRRGQRDALDGRIHLTLPGEMLGPHVWVGKDARIAPGAILEGTVLVGAGSHIEPKARVLAGSVIGERSVIRAGAVIQGATIGSGCEIGPDAVLQDCVLDEAVTVGADCRVSEGAIIGCGCRLASGVRLDPGQRVDPHLRLSPARAVDGDGETVSPPRTGSGMTPTSVS
jgi:mannose-1-phosphate guanylyltransferase/phosphomannomutase